MKLGTIAVSITMAGILGSLLSGIGNERLAEALEWKPTEYEPWNACDFGDCSDFPELSGSGKFENDQDFGSGAKVDQELKIEQNVKCEHVHTCNPAVYVEKSLTTQDEREYKTEQEYEGTSGGNDDNVLDIYVSFSQEPDYYGNGVISVNDVKLKFDVEEELEEYGSPLHTTYEFIGYQPGESKVCVKNLDSDEKNCHDVYNGQDEVRLQFPD